MARNCLAISGLIPPLKRFFIYTISFLIPKYYTIKVDYTLTLTGTVFEEQVTSARKRAKSQLEKIAKTIDNLLDNITETNRDHIDRRLNELTAKKRQIEARLEELERLSLSQAEIDTIVAESMQFLAGLEFTLHQGLPQEKLVALRQCIEKISIDKPAEEIKMAVYLIPTVNLQTTSETKISV